MATWVFDRPTATSTADVTPSLHTAALSNSPAGLTDGSVTAVDFASTASAANYVGNSGDGLASNVRIISGGVVLAGLTSTTYEALSANRTTSGTIATSAISFGYVLTTATKAQWDAATVEYQQIVSKDMGLDGGNIVWAAVTGNITVTYTVATSTPIVVQDSSNAHSAGNLTITHNAPSSSADLSVTYSPKANWAVVELGASVTKGSDSAFTNTVEAVPSTSQAYYPTANSVVISATGIVTGTPELDIDFQWWDSSSSTWKQETYPVILQIVTNDSLHSVTSDNLTLTQTSPNFTVVTNNTTHGVVSDNLTLTAHSQIITASASHVLTSDNLALTYNAVVVSSADLAVSYNAQTGWVVQELTSAVKTGDSVFASTVEAIPDESQVYYPSANSASVDSTGIATATLSFDLQWWNSSTSVWKQLTYTAVNIIVTNDAAHAVSSDNLTLSQVPPNFTVVTNDSSHTVISDNVGLTGHSPITVNSSLHASIADNATLTAHSPIVINGSIHSSVSDNVSLTANSPIIANSANHTVISDNLTLTANSQIVVNSSLHDHNADNIALTTNSALVLNNSAHNVVSDVATLTSHSPITVNDSLHNQASDNLTLSQVPPTGSIVVNNSAHAVASDNVILTAHSQIVTNNASHSLVSDNLVLTEIPPSFSVVINDSANALISDNVSLTAHSLITVNDSLHSQLAGNISFVTPDSADLTINYQAQAGWEVVETVSAPIGVVGKVGENFTGSIVDGSQFYYPTAFATSITADGTITSDSIQDIDLQFFDKSDSTWKQVKLLITITAIVVNDASHSLTSDNLTLSQVPPNFTLVTNNSSHASSSDNLQLVANSSININDSLHSSSADNLTLTAANHYVLAINEATHSQSADVVTLVSNSPINVNDSSHNVASDNLTLSSGQTLAINDALSAHNSDNVVAIAHTPLTVNSTIHGHASDSLNLGVNSQIVIANSYHLHEAQNARFILEIVAERYGIVLAEDREFTVTQRDSTFTVEIDNRVFIVTLENRMNTILTENRRFVA